MRGLSKGMGIEFSTNDATQSPITLLTASINVLAETASVGAVAATLSIVGDDYVAPASFIITSDPSGFFEIADDELLVKSGASFDYETTPSYPIIIEGTDSAPHTYSKTVQVQISNVNEAPTAIQLSANFVDENTADVFIGTFTASDVDIGDSAAFTITADASGFFEIIDGDQLWAKASAALDYETATSHDITVQVADGGALTFSDTFTINVNNINETPLDISLGATTTSETTSIGDVIATISSSGDPDAGDTATYTIVSDPDNKFLIDGTDLKLNGALDYATATDHNVTIRVTDSGALFYDELFVIDVTEAASGFDINALPNLHFNLDGELSTIVTGAGSQVTEVDDLGPADNDATQPTSSRQPSTGGSLNGLNALIFGSSDQLLIPVPTGSDFSVFVAVMYPTVETERTIIVTPQVSLYITNGPVKLGVRTDLGFEKSTYIPLGNVPFVFGAVGSKTGGGTMYANGSAVGTWSGTTLTQTTSGLGFGDNSWESWPHVFGQAVYCEEQLSAQNIIDLQAALLKWIA